MSNVMQFSRRRVGAGSACANARAGVAWARGASAVHGQCRAMGMAMRDRGPSGDRDRGAAAHRAPWHVWAKKSYKKTQRKRIIRFTEYSF